MPSKQPPRPRRSETVWFARPLAAKGLLDRVFTLYPRLFDVVLGDALYRDAPFINFCLEHGKHAIVTIRGDHRLLLHDAEGLFAQQTLGQWTEGNSPLQFWDVEGFTSAEGVKKPLRVLQTIKTTRRRQRVARHWQEIEDTKRWCWAITLSQRQLPTRHPQKPESTELRKLLACDADPGSNRPDGLE